MKAVNQLLAGIHLVVCAEALAFAKQKGMDLVKVFEVVSRGAASSYMLHDRELVDHVPVVSYAERN